MDRANGKSFVEMDDEIRRALDEIADLPHDDAKGEAERIQNIIIACADRLRTIRPTA